MKILAIDTSTEACSVALNQDHEITEQFQIAPMRHTELLLPMIQQTLAETSTELANLDAITFGCGPGSFTGIRIAAAITQGLALSHELPVIPISTLLALAQTAYDQKQIKKSIPCLDARMHEVYWASCQLNENNLMEFVESEFCTKPDVINIPSDDYWGIGSGWQMDHEIIQQKKNQLQGITEGIYPHAAAIAKLAVPYYDQQQMLAAEAALPSYLRDMQY